MAVKLTVRVGGDSGATLVNYTAQVPAFGEDSNPLYQAGMQCDNGSACQYQFTVHDDIGEIPRANLTKNLASHNQVTISEDGPGFDAWLSRGRIADKGWGRGDKPWGDARSADVTVDDANTDMRGLALLTDWVRGAESGRARVLALLSAFLNGSPRLTTVIDTHLVAAGGEVTMPAKTYPAGTELPEIAEDCAGVEGKVWSVVIHHLASVSHLCFLYIDDGDHTTYASTLSITDSSPNLTTSFPPIWDQGDASIESGGDNPISHIVSRYGQDDSGFIVKTDPTITTAYDYWAVPYNDSVSVSPTEAGHRAQSTLVSRGKEHVTHQVTIKLRADQVHLLCAGMSIVLRAVASMGGQYLGTNQTRRIAQLKWELVAPDVGAVDGYYLAHMQLDRPQKLLAQGKGLPVPLKPPTTTETLYDLDFELGQHISHTVPVWPSGTGPWPFNNLNVSAPNPVAHGGAWGVVFGGTTPDPSANSPALPATQGVTYRWRIWAHTDANAANNDLLDVVFYDYVSGSPVELARYSLTPNVPVNMWTEYVSDLTAPANTQFMQMFTVQGYGSGVNSGYDDVLVTIQGTGVGTVGGTGSAAAGSPGNYIPAGSVLEHGSITIGGPYHMAEDVTIADAGGDFTATTVEGALDELQADAEAHAVAADPHAGYVKEAEFTAAADSLVGTGSGTVIKRKHNESASTAPTVNEDSGDGYAIGSHWIDTTADKEYVALDVTVGAAVWKERTNPASGGATIIVREVGGADIEDVAEVEFDASDFVVTEPSAGVARVELATPGGGVSSPFWWHADNAPGGANDREFNEGTVIGTLTRVSHGTPKGTWAEVNDGLEWTHTVSAVTELDVFAIPLTISVGDYVTLAASFPGYTPSALGSTVGFSNGTTFGTSNALAATTHLTGATYRHLFNSWPGHNSLGTNSTFHDVGLADTVYGWRVKYEAANTWGFYVRSPGTGVWRAIQTNYAYTMTPTHVIFGIQAFNSPAFSAANGVGVRLECFRMND